jgi:VWFA-related protein
MPMLARFMRRARPAICPAFLLITTIAAPQESTFKTQSNLVSVPTLVRDSNGNAVYGLHAEDFIVEDDNVKQTVQLDETSESGPISLVIAVQCGRRASREFARINGLASMLDPVLNEPNVEAALLLFDSKFNLNRDFTSDANSIENDLRNLRSGDGGAAILDAVAYSTRLLALQPSGRRRVLLLISETRDHGSHFTKLDDAIRLVGSTNTAVYALPFSPYFSQQLDAARGVNKDEWPANVDILEKLAAARQSMKRNTPRALTAMTGGEYEMFATRTGFETDMNSFANHLNSRYLLSFEPQDPHPGLHTIHVRLRDQRRNQQVLFRRTYWAVATGHAAEQ